MSTRDFISGEAELGSDSDDNDYDQDQDNGERVERSKGNRKDYDDSSEEEDDDEEEAKKVSYISMLSRIRS